MAFEDISGYNEKFQAVEHLLKSAWKSRARQQRWTPALWTLVLVLVYWITVVLLEQILYMSWPVKTILWAVMILIAVAAFVRIRKKKQPVSFTSFYRQLSDKVHWPELKNLLDLHYSTKDSLFRTAAMRQNLEVIHLGRIREILKNDKSEPESRFYRLGVQMFGLTFLLFLGSVFKTPAPHERMLRFWTSFLPPNPYDFTVSPGNRVVNQNDSVRVFIKVRGDRQPDLVRLEIKTDRENNFRIQPMIRQQGNVYESKPFVPVTGTTYRVQMDRYYSQRYRIEVELRPRFRSLSVIVHPPAYTRMDTSVIRYPFASIDAYPGSEIELYGTFNKPVTRLQMIRHVEGDTLLASDNRQGLIDSLHLNFKLGKRDSCSFVMEDSAGLKNDNPFAFVLNPIDDAQPTVQLTKPASDLSMLRPDTLTIEYELSDDFGFHSVALYYEIKKSFIDNPISKSIRLPVPSMPKSIQTYRWDLKSLNLDPLDEVRFKIEAKDDDRFAGYQKGQSVTRLIRMESIAETINETGHQEQNIIGVMDSLREANEDLSSNMDAVTRELSSSQNGNSEAKQHLDQLAKKQDKMDQIAKRLSSQVDSLRSRLNKDNLISPGTLKKYDELKKLIDQIKDPDLRKALEELQKSLSGNQDDLNQALKNYHFNEQMYRERLQRTIDLFKMLRLTLSLDKMEKAVNELEKREKGLVSKGKQLSSLAEQKQIQNELNHLMSHADSLQTHSPSRFKSMMRSVGDSLHKQSDIANAMLNKNLDNMRQENPDMSSIHKEQAKISNRFGRMARILDKAMQKMNRRQAQLNLMALKNIMQDVLLLSDVQEGIAKDVGRLKRGTDVFIDRARDEHNIQQVFTNVADSLRQLASQVPVLSESITRKKQDISDQLDLALDALTDRDPDASKETTTGVLSGLNELGSMLESLIGQLSSSQSGMGGSMMSYNQMLKQLQQLSAGQKGLNDQIQNLMNDLQGNQLSENQIERFKQMASQQDMIRRQLEALQRSGALESGDKALSDLQRVTDQMNNTVNDLRGASVDRTLITRQQNILSRMLSAENALQKRGESKKRQSETANDIQSKPPATTMEQLKQELSKQREAAQALPFSPEYRQLIERYFQLLQQELSKNSDQ